MACTFQLYSIWILLKIWPINLANKLKIVAQAKYEVLEKLLEKQMFNQVREVKTKLGTQHLISYTLITLKVNMATL